LALAARPWAAIGSVFDDPSSDALARSLREHMHHRGFESWRIEGLGEDERADGDVTKSSRT
jgi:hypothetical protein